jgi:hypothetical protein
LARSRWQPGIIALEPAFTTGAALGVALVAIGLGISFFAAQQWGLLGTATTIIGGLLAGGVIGFAEANFAALTFSALLFLVLAVAIRSNFLMALCRDRSPGPSYVRADEVGIRPSHHSPRISDEISYR